MVMDFGDLPALSPRFSGKISHLTNLSLELQVVREEFYFSYMLKVLGEVLFFIITPD